MQNVSLHLALISNPNCLRIWRRFANWQDQLIDQLALHEPAANWFSPAGLPSRSDRAQYIFEFLLKSALSDFGESPLHTLHFYIRKNVSLNYFTLT